MPMLISGHLSIKNSSEDFLHMLKMYTRQGFNGMGLNESNKNFLFLEMISRSKQNFLDHVSLTSAYCKQTSTSLILLKAIKGLIYRLNKQAISKNQSIALSQPIFVVKEYLKDP